jgi:hypothetical protein
MAEANAHVFKAVLINNVLEQSYAEFVDALKVLYGDILS